ncbi:unnamed protein product [Ceratitis capitata]|uniref:(Mediterranean fruit fly) hypothetical protein n=1 Tax=Ceratitis capitata TaxID=7213 RepID=A0A811U006_CERCA|nr:unnamed protein product [Ceratitis capitata]
MLGNRFFPLDVEEHMGSFLSPRITKSNVFFEYFIYHLRPYGINNTLESLPERLKVAQTLPPPVAQSLAIEMNSTTQKL